MPGTAVTMGKSTFIVGPPCARVREARKGWAALIKQVYEIDPLSCPKCGAEMKIVSFIERHQTEVIEKILRYCELWEEAPPGVLLQSPSQWGDEGGWRRSESARPHWV